MWWAVCPNGWVPVRWKDMERRKLMMIQDFPCMRWFWILCSGVKRLRSSISSSKFFFQIVSGFGPTPFRWILRIFCMFLLLVERWLPTKMFHRLGFTSMTALTCILKWCVVHILCSYGSQKRAILCRYCFPLHCCCRQLLHIEAPRENARTSELEGFWPEKDWIWTLGRLLCYPLVN